MNIAIIGTRGIPANYSGFETCVHETAARFVNYGHHVRVYCRKGMVGSNVAAVHQIERVFVPFISGKFSETFSHTFFSVLHLFVRRVDVVQVYGAGSGWFVPILRILCFRIVFMIDGIDWHRAKWGTLSKWFLRIGGTIGAHSAHISVSDSQEVISALLGIIPSVHFHFVPYGAKLLNNVGKSALEQFGLRPGKYFLFVGRFVPEKNVHLLIEAFELAATERILVLVGGGQYTNEYEQTLRSTKCERIIFTGFLYGKQYEEVLSNCYAYIQPSALEGTSPSLLAAMGAGCAVLVSDIPENRETVGSAGEYFIAGDHSALRAAIEQLDRHPEVVCELGKKARVRVTANYSWDVVANSLLQLISKALNRIS